MAVSVWLPLVAVMVFQDIEYGEAVSSAPSAAPSSRNWTPTTPPLSLAVAGAVTMPDTVAPGPGTVMDTVGAVASSVVHVRSPETARLPAASRERTRTW